MDLCLISHQGVTAFLKSSFPPPECQGIYFGSYLPETLKDAPLKFALSGDFLTSRDCEEIDQFVWNLSRNWYKGVSVLGEFVEFDLQLLLFKMVRNLTLLSRLISKYQPNHILCFDSNSGLWPLVRDYGTILGIRVTRGELPREKLPAWMETRTFKSWLVDKLTQVLDFIVMRLFLIRRRYHGSVWLDLKLLPQLGLDSLGQRDFPLVPCIFEKGLRVRLKLLKRGEGYFALRQRSRTALPGFFLSPYFRTWRFFDQDPRFRSLFSFKEIDFYPMVRREIRCIILSDFPRIQNNIRRFQNTVTQSDARAIVLRNESRELEKTCVVAAKQTSMRSIVLQHGVFAIPIPDEKVQCDLIAVWGSFAMRYFQSRNHSMSHCVITGNPEYDPLVPQDRDSLAKREELCLNLGLDSRLPILVFASQRPHALSSIKSEDEQEKLLSKVLLALSRIPQVQLVVKVHPFEDERPLGRLVNACRDKKRVRVFKRINLYSLLASTDGVITYNSTVGLTAMILGKPVLCINLTGYPDTVSYVSSGAAVGVYREEDLVPAIQEVLWNQETRSKLQAAQKEFIRDYAFEIDGKAKERLFGLIKGLTYQRFNET